MSRWLHLREWLLRLARRVRKSGRLDLRGIRPGAEEAWLADRVDAVTLAPVGSTARAVARATLADP